MAPHYGFLLFCSLALFVELHASADYIKFSQELKETFRSEEVSLPPPDMIRNQGYPAEEHTVETEDGHIITMHRIPYGKKSPAAENKTVVLLQHGLLCSSADWVMGIPEKSLGFILADAGYDVWMGNARGNTYSRRHAVFSPSDADFWKFSWHEMGKYDMPAEIDYVLEVTKQEKLHYVGHSMGTTMFFVMNSLKPEYNEKIRLMVGLGPVATVGHMKSPIRIIAHFINHVEWITNMMGVNEFMPNNGLLEYLAETLCGGDLTNLICSNILFAIAGFNKAQLNMTMLPVIIGHTPAGTSTRTLVHYLQEVNSGTFSYYDFGKKGNVEKYGQEEPPQYDLSKVTAPIALYWGENDWLANPQDVHLLAPKLQNLIGKFRVNLDEFNHLDFLWATDADKLLYNQVIEMLKHF